ncbi:MAG: hypothetical protein ACM3H7_08845 [Acidobacteriaceae bacterium]
MIKKISFLWIIVILLEACGTTSGSPPTPASATDTPAPTALPSATIVWFPPTSTPTAFPSPVITPTEDLRPKLGSILMEDDFSSHSGWTLTQSQAGSIAYGKDELTIAIGETNAYLYSIREEPIFTDFYLEITAEPNLCNDLDEYGVLLRVSPAFDYYRFSLSCNGQVRLDRVSGGQASSPQPWMMSGAVPPGAPSSSRLGVSAIGDELSFFVNGQYQFTVHDPLLTSGGLGVFARSVNKKAVTVNFSDLLVSEVIP